MLLLFEGDRNLPRFVLSSRLLPLSFSGAHTPTNIDWTNLSTRTANAAVTDFLYTCPSHLADPGVRAPTAATRSHTVSASLTFPTPQFARPAPSTSTSGSSTPIDTPPAPSVPQSEIDRVTKEYHERQQRKKDGKATASDKEADSKSWLSASLSGLGSLASSATSSLLAAAPAPEQPAATTVASSAKVFVLNRDIFAMRQASARKVWQAKEAKERAAKLSLPAAPRGGLASAKGPAV